jgi:type IV pilus assembly protein PilX
MKHRPLPPRALGQSGVTLIVVLLVLMVVTLLGVGGAQIALLSERATRYDRDYQIAFQAAEAALLDAEFDIRGDGTFVNSSRKAMFTEGSTIGFAEGCSSDAATVGMCLPAAPGATPVWATVDFLATSSPRSVKFGAMTNRDFSSGATGIQPELPPRYVIEVLKDELLFTKAEDATKYLYRITAIGFGPRKEVQAVLQTIFRKE